MEISSPIHYDDHGSLAVRSHESCQIGRDEEVFQGKKSANSMDRGPKRRPTAAYSRLAVYGLTNFSKPPLAPEHDCDKDLASFFDGVAPRFRRSSLGCMVPTNWLPMHTPDYTEYTVRIPHPRSLRELANASDLSRAVTSSHVVAPPAQCRAALLRTTTPRKRQQ